MDGGVDREDKVIRKLYLILARRGQRIVERSQPITHRVSTGGTLLMLLLLLVLRMLDALNDMIVGRVGHCARKPARPSAEPRHRLTPT